MIAAMSRTMEWGSIALVVCMVAASELLGTKDVIFPEIAALAFGAWVLEERPWPGPAWTIWFSPTLGALTGVLVLQFLPYPLLALVGIAFALVLLELRLTRSAMSPALSATVLPIITNIRGWVYPVCVCLMTGGIAWLTHCRDRKRPGCGQAVSERALAAPMTWQQAVAIVAHHGKLVFFLLAVALLAVELNWLYLIAPPLLVAFFELTEPDSALRRQSAGRLLFFLTASSLGGAVWVLLVVRLLSWPLWLVAGLAVATVFALVRLCRIASPPAFALALLPCILPATVVPWYPLQVCLGGLLFLLASRIGFKAA